MTATPCTPPSNKNKHSTFPAQSKHTPKYERQRMKERTHRKPFPGRRGRIVKYDTHIRPLFSTFSARRASFFPECSLGLRTNFLLLLLGLSTQSSRQALQPPLGPEISEGISGFKPAFSPVFVSFPYSLSQVVGSIHVYNPILLLWLLL